MWMLWGNMAVFLCAGKVAEGTAPVMSSVLFWSFVAALVAGRYVDITRCGGTTAEGEPATLAHWRSYAIRVVIVSAVLWGLARFVAARGWM